MTDPGAALPDEATRVRNVVTAYEKGVYGPPGSVDAKRRAFEAIGDDPAPAPPPAPLRERAQSFALIRDVDATGISGTGRVAQGFLFDDGTVALRWLTEHRSTALYASIDEVDAIHGHNGSTRIVWDAALAAPVGVPAEGLRGWHPSFFERHADDGHGGCIRCRFAVPNTEDEHTIVPYPCPFALAAAPPATGSGECPVCGQTFPHYHRDTADGDEIVRLPAEGEGT